MHLFIYLACKALTIALQGREGRYDKLRNCISMTYRRHNASRPRTPVLLKPTNIDPASYSPPPSQDH